MLRLDLLGSPEMFVVAVVDADITFGNPSDETLQVAEHQLLEAGGEDNTVDALFESERAAALTTRRDGALAGDPYPLGRRCGRRRRSSPSTRA